MVTLYAALLGAVVFERLLELVISSRHAHRLLARGGIERGQGHYPTMVALHVALLAGCVIEPIALHRPFSPWLGLPMLALVVLAQGLRWWAVATLGDRWSTRVIVLPGAPRVGRGPYRFFPHPNYVAVVIEGFALPLVHSAWLTAVGFTLLNALVLATRIRVEDAALDAAEPA